MTPWHYRWLCQFSYINPPGPLREGTSLGALALELLSLNENHLLACGSLSAADLETLSVIRATKQLHELILVGFINRNPSTGLVVYVFRAPDDSIHIIFRGSETRGCGVPTAIDWLDNFIAPFLGSVQYREIEALAGRYPESRVCFSGHSKGAHNALYALASIANPRAQAVTFNGQGFAPGMFTKPQKKRLRQQGVNYVVRGDLVGTLLHHPEKRVFVKRQGSDHPHALSSLTFDSSGQPTPARRPVWSYAVEWGTMRCLLARQLRSTRSNVEML